MKKRKNIWCLAFAWSLAFSTVSYGAVTISPISTVTETSESSEGASIGPTVAAQTADTGSSVAQPTVQSEGAVLLDAATGEVLFGKNENKQFYPASITKVMTGLLVAENCNLSDTVTFSATATTNLESGAVSLGVSEGDVLTVEQCMYGLLLKSANEIGNGLAEHIAGSVSAFADRMNARAKELGCQNTHFTNPHGLNDSNHYTTPYDMALIARAAFQNETFRKVDTTLSYNFPALKNAAAKTITMGHKMMYSTDSRYYPGIIGGKTGYTSLAGNTLVTGAERGGVRLVAVVMKSRSTHYADTKALLDYGFAVRGVTSDGTSESTGTGNTGASGQSGTSDTQTQSEPGAAVSPLSPLAGNAAGTTVGPNAGADSGSGTASSTGTSSGSGTGTADSASVRIPAGDWKEDANGWTYGKTDGTSAAGEWIREGEDYYWIDANGYMARGWRQFTDGTWYYFRSSGRMAKNYWAPSGSSWFYMGADGKLMTNATTPDGYRVDENGKWVE